MAVFDTTCMNRYSIVLLLFIAAVVCSCNKKKVLSPATQEEKGDAAVTIVNNMPDSVYILLNGRDIATGTLPDIIAVGIPARDSVVFEAGELKTGYRYGYEWHTKDYKASSWMQTGTDGRAVQLSFDYYLSGNDTAIYLQGENRNELLVLLDGDGVSSTWVATDAFDAAGASVWGAISQRERNHSFDISRFHTVKHRFTDTSNKAASTNLAFKMNVTQPRVWLNIAYPTDSFILTNDLAPYATLNTGSMQELFYARMVIDKGIITYPGPYFKLVRQSVER